jgi:hypothetical protein
MISAHTTAPMAAAPMPRKNPVKYWASVNSILMAPKEAVYSPTS